MKYIQIDALKFKNGFFDMFLIAGISPKIRIVDHTPRICPSCGLPQARLKRVDSYFNLFFIPVLRVKKGEPFISCDRCNNVAPEFYQHYRQLEDRANLRCSNCDTALENNFQYCPFCGKPQ